MGSTAISHSEACQLLGLTSPVSTDRLAVAFRKAAKAAHPDTEGGNVIHFRRVIDAYHLLQKCPADSAAPLRPVSLPPRLSPLASITPMQALHGGSVTVDYGQQKLLVHVPPGMRTGDQLRLDNIGKVAVIIRPADDMTVLKSDLFVTYAIPERFLRDGGRIEIETHAGPQIAWLVPDMVEPVRLYFKGLGLPATRKHHAGDLFVKLEGREDMPSAAEDMLIRFTKLWTAEAAAA